MDNIISKESDEMHQEVWCALYIARLGPDTVPEQVAAAADVDISVLDSRGLVEVMRRVAVRCGGT